MNRGVLAAAAAFVACAPASAAVPDPLTFDPGTYSFQFESDSARVWTVGDFNVATDLAGDIQGGVIFGSDIQTVYSRNLPLLSVDVRGADQVFVQKFDQSGQSPADTPGTYYNLTDAFQTISFGPNLKGFLFRLSSTASFQADNFVFGDDGLAPGAVPEPATWALMILGFAGVGGVTRARRSSMSLLAPTK